MPAVLAVVHHGDSLGHPMRSSYASESQTIRNMMSVFFYTMARYVNSGFRVASDAVFDDCSL